MLCLEINTKGLRGRTLVQQMQQGNAYIEYRKAVAQFLHVMKKIVLLLEFKFILEQLSKKQNSFVL